MKLKHFQDLISREYVKISPHLLENLKNCP